MRKKTSQTWAALCLLLAGLAPMARAEIKLPAIFGDNMVLQRDTALKIWGWDTPGQSVSVEITGKSGSATADADGKWTVNLPALATSATPLELKIAGSNTVTLKNVLVGEVWLCSGQSNMQWSVSQSDDPDLEALTAKYPKIRLITVPQVGTQEPQTTFAGAWVECSPETVRDFSGVGYFFGRTLHQVLDVPIGLIDNSWGGSAAEAWVKRSLLEADPIYKSYVDGWVNTEKTYNFAAAQEAYKVKKAEWDQAKAEGKAVGNPPQVPRDLLGGNSRPGNLYNGVLKPVIGYGIRGAIWYQGESNADRAQNYRQLLPLMIKSWREEWGQGDFPFYWVQLADFKAETTQPQEAAWPELREAQTMTLSLPNTGEAVIYDLGEAADIHPKDKQNVAKRLARLALAKNYGIPIVANSPRYDSLQVAGNKAVVTFKEVGGGMDTFDVPELKGFTIAGEDKKWVNAQAKIVGKDKIEVWSPSVAAPVAVRYAWSDNPIANVQNAEGLPLTPFRSDDWMMFTSPEGVAARAAAAAAAAPAAAK